MTRLDLGADAVDRIAADVAHHGSLGVETGALLLTPPDNPTVTVVALPGTAGINRRDRLLVLSSTALNPLFAYAEDNNLQLRAQVHSHLSRAFLSHTDKTGNIRMPGFIASVIPNFAAPPLNPASWGWWVFSDGDWVRTEPPAVTTQSTKFIAFDADGVCEY